MQDYVKIGGDIIVGKGFAAKHWSGPVIVGRDAIYLCPNIDIKSLLNGVEPGLLALGLIGGLANAALKLGEAKSQSTWKNHVVALQDLPAGVRQNPHWPVKKGKRPVIVMDRGAVATIERHGGKLLVAAHGDNFKLGLKFFGRGKALELIRELGWDSFR